MCLFYKSIKKDELAANLYSSFKPMRLYCHFNYKLFNTHKLLISASLLLHYITFVLLLSTKSDREL